MGLDELKDKAGDAGVEKVSDAGIEKAGDAADAKLGGKGAEQVDRAQQAADARSASNRARPPQGSTGGPFGPPVLSCPGE